MNCEESYSEYRILEREMKDKISGVQKLHKMIAGEMENRNLRSFHRNIALLESAVAGEARVLSATKELEAGFNSRGYFGSGGSVVQMLETCGELGADMKGELPVYKMLPYRAKVDMGDQDLYLDRKKVQCIRPGSFARQVRAGQGKLMRTSFSALTFANELADVYDLVLLKSKRQPEVNIYLTNLYKLLAPMGRSRRDYDQRSYAFDSARFYGSGVKEIKDGRRIQLGPSREGNRVTRILSSQEREEYLLTIRFFR